MPAHKLTTDAERFLRKVDRLSTPDGCWLWTGGTGSKGYGLISTGSRAAGTFKMKWANRFALELRLGRPILPGMQALHTCDNPACVRADDEGTYELNGVLYLRHGHLWEGTTQANTADRQAKGRGASGARNGVYVHPERLVRGTGQWLAKLTDDKVREIRRRAAAGERPIALAAEFGVWNTTIHKIIHRESWKHV